MMTATTATRHLIVPPRDIYAGRTILQVSPPSSPDWDNDQGRCYPEDVSPIDQPNMSQFEMLRAIRKPPSPPQGNDVHASSSLATGPPLHGSMTNSQEATIASASIQSNSSSPSLGQRMLRLGKHKPDPVDNRSSRHSNTGFSKLVAINIARRGSRQMEDLTIAQAPGAPPLQNGGPVTPNPKPSRHHASKPSFFSRPGKQHHEARIQSHAPSSSSTYATNSLGRPNDARYSLALTSHPPDSISIPPPQLIKRKPSSADKDAVSRPRVPRFSESPPQVITSAGHYLDAVTEESASCCSSISDDTCVTAKLVGLTAPNPNSTKRALDAGDLATSVDMTPMQASVMSRSRPLSSGRGERASVVERPIVISLKGPTVKTDRAGGKVTAKETAAPPGRPMVSHRRAASDGESVNQRPSGAMVAKPLPPAPPELLTSSHDRVAYLNAQIQGLAHRRINIHRSIRQILALMPADDVMASNEVLRKRRDEKLKVDSLKDELAEVQKEEHELGLKLHRAYKRMDKNAEFEPTTLWVRRVTT